MEDGEQHSDEIRIVARGSFTVTHANSAITRCTFLFALHG